MTISISLRKANAIQLAITDLIKTIPIHTSLAISIFQDTDTELANSSQKFYANHQRKLHLIDALDHIRIVTGKANVESGVHELLTTIAGIDRRLNHYAPLVASVGRMDDIVIKGKLAKLAEPSALDYHRNDSVSVGLFSETDIDHFAESIRGMKKSAQDMKDKVLELNIKHSIELHDGIVDILTKEKIL